MFFVNNKTIQKWDLKKEIQIIQKEDQKEA